MALVFFCSGACMALFAVSQLLVKDKQPLHYWMSIDCFAISYLYFYFGAVREQSIRLVPAALVSSDISAMYIVIPLFFMASRSILGGGVPDIRRFGVFFIGPLAFALAFGLYNGLTSPSPFRSTASLPGHFDTPLLSIIMTIPGLVFPTAIGTNLVASLRILVDRGRTPSAAIKTQAIFLSIYFVLSLGLFAACILRSEHLLSLAFAAFGLAAACFTLTCTSVIYFIERQGASLGKPAPSRPDWDASAEEIQAKLDRILIGTSLYKDAELALPRLARLMGVDQKRLSYHFKTVLGTNFRGYINDIRLQAVSRDLRERPSASILDIALEHGFNSKSSFNSLFIGAFGLTPREYRSRAGAAELGESAPRRA
jgi:AraC-like DNA-binding protein